MSGARLDGILGLLADQYRRQIIETLHQSPAGEVNFDELIDAIHQRPIVERESRDRLATQVHHNHPPKLHEQRIFEYDTDTNLVRYTPDHEIGAVVEDISAKESIPTSEDKRTSLTVQ